MSKRTAPQGWYQRVTEEEKEQAIAIRLWKNPEIKGYEGLFAFGDLYYEAIAWRSLSTLPETTLLSASDPIQELISADLVAHVEQLLRPCEIDFLEKYSSGKSLEGMSKIYQVSASSLCIFLEDLREKICARLIL